MNGKDIFRSIGASLGSVEAQINVQADLIVASWQHNGHQAEHIDRVVHHILKKPGKMLRPALVLLSAGMVREGQKVPILAEGAVPPASASRGSELQEALHTSLIKLAAAVELIHSASLIHDDIIDDERLRRGQTALHRKHGNQTAVLVGDILYAQSFSLITGLKVPDWQRHLAIYQLFCDTTRSMCLGEITEQRVIDGKLPLDFPDYLHILENKTAVLMSACCKSGAILAGAGEATATRLADFGTAFGLAFQLLDDHQDRDALIDGRVDIVTAALEQMDRARSLLALLPDSVYRRELIGTCDFVLQRAGAAVGQPGSPV